MHPVDRHRTAVAMANLDTFNRFGFHGPYEPGTAAHSFWLTIYDRALAVMILRNL